jgi:uncharacterized repeat protein (TIGR03803 family)
MRRSVSPAGLLVGMAALGLAGCGGGTSPSPSSSTYTLGGTVSGLSTGESLILLDNGGDALTVSSDGGFRFSTTQIMGSTYRVAVQSHTPGITCPVSNGSGTVGASNVTNVAVSCTAGTESILYSFTGGTTDGAQPAAGLIMDNGGNLYGTCFSGGSNNYGTVFKISAAGAESVLHFFAGYSTTATDAGQPMADLIVDSAGNIYGTTASGGLGNNGTVFKINAAATESVLYSFAGQYAGDGQGSEGNLIMDSAGNLYGTTELGGADNSGTVFKISPSGAESVLHSFVGGTTDGAGPVAGLVMDSAGNLYGTTPSGGAYGAGTVFKVSASGAENVLYSFAGGATDGQDSRARLIMDSAGNLYGTTANGGPSGAGTVFKISATGTESIVHFFGVGNDGAAPMAGLAMDSAGNLYGTTQIGGANGSGTVFKISAVGTESTLYSFEGGTTDGSGPTADLIIDSAGNLYGTTGSGGPNNDGTVFKMN